MEEAAERWETYQCKTCKLNRRAKRCLAGRDDFTANCSFHAPTLRIRIKGAIKRFQNWIQINLDHMAYLADSMLNPWED